MNRRGTKRVQAHQSDAIGRQRNEVKRGCKSYREDECLIGLFSGYC